MHGCPHCGWQSWQPGESHRCPVLQHRVAADKPKLFRGQTCSICREEDVPCFSILADMKPVWACVRCMESGKWRDADKASPETHYYCGGIVEGSRLIKIINHELNKRGRKI